MLWAGGRDCTRPPRPRHAVLPSAGAVEFVRVLPFPIWWSNTQPQHGLRTLCFWFCVSRCLLFVPKASKVVDLSLLDVWWSFGWLVVGGPAGRESKTWTRGRGVQLQGLVFCAWMGRLYFRRFFVAGSGRCELSHCSLVRCVVLT